MSSEVECVVELINTMQDETISEHIVYTLGKMGWSNIK